MIKAFTDGSSKGNGQKNCLAGCGVYYPGGIKSGDNEPISISMRLSDAIKQVKYDGLVHDTNNTGELMAILLAMYNISQKDIDLMIYSDSMYCINSIVIWSKGWIKNGWVASTGKPVKNKEIIQRILEERKKFKNVVFIHVKAHRKAPPKDSEDYILWYGNDQADQLASRSVHT